MDNSNLNNRKSNPAPWQRIFGIYILAFFLVAFSFHSGKNKNKNHNKKHTIHLFHQNGSKFLDYVLVFSIHTIHLFSSERIKNFGLRFSV